MFKVFETKTYLMRVFRLEENVLDAGDCSAVSVANVVMKDIANLIWTRNGRRVAFAFWQSCWFATGKDWIVSGVANDYRVLG